MQAGLAARVCTQSARRSCFGQLWSMAALFAAVRSVRAPALAPHSVPCGVYNVIALL